MIIHSENGYWICYVLRHPANPKDEWDMAPILKSLKTLEENKTKAKTYSAV